MVLLEHRNPDCTSAMGGVQKCGVFLFSIFLAAFCNLDFTTL